MLPKPYTKYLEYYFFLIVTFLFGILAIFATTAGRNPQESFGPEFLLFMLALGISWIVFPLLMIKQTVKLADIYSQHSKKPLFLLYLPSVICSGIFVSFAYNFEWARKLYIENQEEFYSYRYGLACSVDPIIVYMAC